MTYSLWSRGRLLGHSDLGYVRFQPLHRGGTLVPTEEGERLLPVASGVGPATIALGRAMRGFPLEDPTFGAHRPPAQEQADLLSALDERDALGLVLRGPDGNLIPTEWIDVRDCTFLQSLGEEAIESASHDVDPDEALIDDLGDDLEANLEALLEDEEPWLRDADPDDTGEEPEIRYQLSVRLLDDNSVP